MTDLATHVALTQLTVDVIAEEARRRWSYPGAARPLHDFEARARVHFADIDDLWQDLVSIVAERGFALRVETETAVLAALTAATTAQDVVDILNRWLSPTAPDTLTLPSHDRVLREAAEAMAAAQVAAANQLLDEARRQAVPGRLLPDPDDLTPTTDELAAIAVGSRWAVETGVRQVIDTAHREALYAAGAGLALDALRDRITAAFGAVTEKQGVDAARQVANRAISSGRAAAAAQTPEPSEVYASELLDSNTCDACSAVDGRLYDSLASALVDYPGAGAFVNCAGGARCRGTLVLVWDEATATVDRGRGEAGHDIDRTPRGPISREGTDSGQRISANR